STLMLPEPNWFAVAALLCWPLVALWLYCIRPANQATLWTILGGQLLLPVGAAIKFGGIPQFDKVSIPNLTAFFFCLLFARSYFRSWRTFGTVEILLLMYLLSPFITAELNQDPILITGRILMPEDLYDALSAVIAQSVAILPFLLGRQVLR